MPSEVVSLGWGNGITVAVNLFVNFVIYIMWHLNVNYFDVTQSNYIAISTLHCYNFNYINVIFLQQCCVFIMFTYIGVK